MTIQQAFEGAIQHHQSGRLAEAEALYRQILAVEPHHSDALHFLGVIAHQVGRHEVAMDLIRQAIAVSPGVPDYHSNLGEACRAVGQRDEAIAAYRQALALRSDFPEAHNNLGNALRDKGQLDEAIAAFRQAIALKSNYAEAHSNLGNALGDNGQLDEAIAVCRQALALKPDDPETRCNLGNALRNKGQLEQAIAACRQAIALKPDYAEAHSNLGVALRDIGQLDEAIAACRQAIALKPGFADAHYNLGNALVDKGLLVEAIAAYRQAIVLKPDYAEAHCNLGAALHAAGRMDEAIATYRQSLVLKPDYFEAYSNLGVALLVVGWVDEAIACFRRALEINPARSDVHGNLLRSLNYPPGIDAPAIAEEHRRWSRQHAEPLRRFIVPHANDRDPERRLRIGYVSPDFREHSVAFFLEGLLKNHDRTLVKLCCYSDVVNPDAVTARVQQSAGLWRMITGMSDAQVADLIRKDGIDILVDLAGHTAKNRLLVFARKPAPVQVTWLGYSNTTGLDTIDYRFTDAIADPPGTTEHLHSEELVRLPSVFACFRPVTDAPPVNPLPAMSAGHVTFASFHILAKLNGPLLECWARVLEEVPDSRLLLAGTGLDEDSQRRRLREFFGGRGIDAARIEFKGLQSLAGYLALHHRVDVLLDSHPFTGHTIGCHALWMGVPVVTLAGRTHCSRMVSSVLTNVGLPELVATNPEQFVKIASDLGKDLPRLRELRATLGERMEASPLMDAPRFARDIEAAYREMWRKWCSRAESVAIAGGGAGQ